jgi:hypothetical protein
LRHLLRAEAIDDGEEEVVEISAAGKQILLVG